jgi:uncharacterized protein YndB with AHSA1/START domain
LPVVGGQVEVERFIAAPAEEVWAMVADVRRMGDWSPETEGCEWLKGATAPVPGARFRGKNAHGKKRWSTVAQVTEATPGEVFSFRVAVGALKVAHWAYRFEPADGGCRVKEIWTDERGTLVTKFGKPISGVADRSAHNRATMVATLDRLAAAAEGNT